LHDELIGRPILQIFQGDSHDPPDRVTLTTFPFNLAVSSIVRTFDLQFLGIEIEHQADLHRMLLRAMPQSSPELFIFAQ
jgi:hypothetical protein